MATYNSDKILGTSAQPPATNGLAGTLKTAYAIVTLSAAPATGDVINFFDLPPNARIHSAVLKASDMDTGGPTLTIDIGDAGAAQRYFAASTCAGTGTVDSTMAAAGRFYKTTAKTRIVGTAHANATTPAAGTLELSVQYTVEDSATS